MALLDSRHHTIIQALLSRGPLQEKDFHSIFYGVTNKDPVSNQKLFNDVLLKINKELSYVQFELRGCRNQYDGKVYYGVVNNASDEQSKLGTNYSVPQIAFYKAVVEAIIQDVTNQGCISNIEALNIRLENQVKIGQGSQDSQSLPPFKSFSMSHKEKALSDLIEDRWLCHTSNGKIGLGVRSFLDLRSWFHNNDIPSCDICNEAGIKASTCSNEACNVRMHDYCSKKIFSQRKVPKVCPGCSTAWPQAEVDNEVEVEVEEEEENVQQETRIPPNDPIQRKRARSCKAEMADIAQTQSPPPSGSELRKKLRRCKRENQDPAEAGPSQHMGSPERRPRRSERINVRISIS